MDKSCSVQKCSIMYSTMLLFGLLMAILKTTGAEVGVCYGMMAKNLPQPSEVIALFQRKNIKRTRLYAPNQAALEALRGTNIKLLLDSPDLEHIAASQGNADQWVRDNVQRYSDVNFQYIAVGNEVQPSHSSARFLFPAMQNMHNAIVRAGLGNKIKVSTATFMRALQTSYPVSNGRFHPDYQQLLSPVINFLNQNQAPLLVNIYPYFARKDDPQNVPLDFALFKAASPNADGYQNLFDSMLDAFYSALEKAGGGSLDIVVSETGWPSAGGPDTSVDNARTYNTKLVGHVNQGTPKKPGKPIHTYLFAMFDENDKEPSYEKHWGLFYPDKREKYPITFN